MLSNLWSAVVDGRMGSEDANVEAAIADPEAGQRRQEYKGLAKEDA